MQCSWAPLERRVVESSPCGALPVARCGRSTLQVRTLKQMGIRVIGCTPDHGERSHGRAVRRALSRRSPLGCTPTCARRLLYVPAMYPGPTRGDLRVVAGLLLGRACGCLVRRRPPRDHHAPPDPTPSAYLAPPGTCTVESTRRARALRLQPHQRLYTLSCAPAHAATLC